MDEQKEIQKQFRDGQEKYIYYLIALCVAAIGFSIHKTLGISMNLFQIPLGIAITSWAISIFFGLRFLEKRLDLLFNNNQYFEILQGRDSDVGTNSENIKIGFKAIEEIMEQKSKNIPKYFTRQKIFFFLGFLSFLAWHILEMYKNTIS